MREGAGVVKGPQMRIARAQLYGLLDECDRLVFAPAPHQREGERKVAMREAWIELDRSLQLRDCRRVVLGHALCAAEHEPADSIALV
ncbi:MAG: hypothetical protein K0R61_288 [Microvirga sp.]|nr:hypothetical protein [Microvirga sp.]